MKSADRSYMKQVLAGGRFQADGFELPDKQRVFRSTRFGDHGFVLDRECLRILPVRVESGATEPALSSRSGRSNGKVVNNRSVPSWPGRVMNVLLGCKSYAASFFW